MVKLALKSTFKFKDFFISTVEQQDTTRRDTLEKSIRQLETHPHREAVKADLTQSQELNHFSEKTMDMLHSMGNVEYFEMCGNHPHNPMSPLSSTLFVW